MRIIGGEKRGAHVEAPKGLIARPMRDRVRAALFNILGAERLEDRNVLDLFAGSGSLGLEALSRGARRCVFIERAPECLAAIQKNVAHLDLADRAVVRRADLARGLEGLRSAGLTPFDLVLMDPPFPLLRRPPGPGEADVKKILAELAAPASGLLAPDAKIALETPAEAFRIEALFPGMGLSLVMRREYGSTAIVLLEPIHAGGGAPETPKE